MRRLILGLFLAGAVWGGAYEEAPIPESDRKHWSWQKLESPEPPEVDDAASVRNPIDRFILKRLEEKGLKFQPEADRPTLIRRLSYDLVGLPSTPDEVDAFVRDRSDDAYEKLVDRLLKSNAYGEHMAQSWLDLARFAETDGFEHDKIRPNAWRYRDWVIEALNQDMPYNQFVQWQIAGDILEPQNPSALVATGFLLAGQDMPDINLKEERRHMVLNDMTASVGAVFMGLGFQCAQCHDHKNDPISQADFYRLRAFFETGLSFDEHVVESENEAKTKGRVMHESGKPIKAHLMVRGDFRRPGMEVTPAYPRIANLKGGRPALAERGKARAELAAWLTRDDHPLTARTMANRIWQHHFGRPLAAQPNDLGLAGEPPTHPALLDWLASEWLRRGWSMKVMHRLIVCSRTYRQVSRRPENQAVWDQARQMDPDNRLYSRMVRRRLSGEVLRDAMLHISGRLNRRMAGPGVRPPLPKEITSTLLNNQWKVSEDATDHLRRSIYIFARRNLRFPMFELFDRPMANESCAMRQVSTTAPQALTLLNDSFSLDCARLLVSRCDDEPSASRAQFYYRHILGRLPDVSEADLATAFLRTHPDQDLCLALFNLNEFLYVD